MKHVFYTALLAFALLQVSTSEAKGGLTGSDIKNPQQLQVGQGFYGSTTSVGGTGVSQNVGQTSSNTATSSSNLDFGFSYGGGLFGNRPLAENPVIPAAKE
jgi:hypothetical protein